MNYNKPLLPSRAPWEVLLRDLLENCVEHQGKRYLVAGQHQFKTIWFRDVCFAILTIMECPEAVWGKFKDVIRNTVDVYLEFFKDDLGYGPKCLDTTSPEWRCIWESMMHATTYRLFNIERADEAMDPDINFQGLYVDGRGSVAIDSNLLVYLVGMLSSKGMDHARLRHLLEWYEREPNMDPHTKLVVQGPHSDWQDSVNRGPSTFHVNLLYWRALRATPGRSFDAIMHQRRMRHHFQRDGMFHAMMPECPDHVCLDDQLLAVHWGFVAPQYFHEKVRHHPVLWLGTPVPGFPTTPNYEDPHWQVKLACLSDYHDACHWSWIIALAGTVCFECGDREEGERIFQALWEARQREGGISELYEVTPEAQLVQLDRFSYLAEKPWTWGLAYTLRLAVQRHA